MEQHIVEILVILMRDYPDGAMRPEDFEPLTNDLIKRGYTQNEIETALFWFHNRQAVRDASVEAEGLAPDSFRILHDIERSILTPRAYGYLIELKQLGLITLAELDAIVEKAVLLGGRKVDTEEIKMFIAAQIMEQQGGFSMPGLNFFLKTPPDRVQ